METTNYQGHHKTKTHCIRGHDRSISRIGEDCIVCDRLRKRGYQRSTREKHLRYVRDLQCRIHRKKEKLERLLHEEENTDGVRAR